MWDMQSYTMVFNKREFITMVKVSLDTQNPIIKTSAQKVIVFNFACRFHWWGGGEFFEILVLEKKQKIY